MQTGFFFSSLEKQHAQPLFRSMFYSNFKLLPAHIFQHIQAKFSPYFPATITCSGTQLWEQKRSRKPVLNHYSLIKTVFKPAPPFGLVLIYSAYIYQHHFHQKKKKVCYSNQDINMQTKFFFQFSSSEKQHAQPIFQSMFSSNCKLLSTHILQHIQAKFSPYFPTTITCSRTQFWEKKRSKKPVLNHYSLIKTVFKPAPLFGLYLIAIAWLLNKD